MTLHKVVKLPDGRFGISVKKGRYLTDSIFATEKEAKVQALYFNAREHQTAMDRIHWELEKLGVVDSRDPHGYLA